MVNAKLAQLDLFQIVEKINVFKFHAHLSLEELQVFAGVTNAEAAKNLSKLAH